MKLSDGVKISNYCMDKPCTYESRPFGEYPICYRVAGKIFAQLSPQENWFKITLKTNPNLADFYRQVYPGIVVRGYHCPPVQQPYWNTIDLDKFDLDALFPMIDEAYDEVVKGLTKKEQRKLPRLADLKFCKTNGTNEEFEKLCKKLDETLDETAGTKVDRENYKKYNLLNSIHDVILVYMDGQAIGCAAYKFYDDKTVELKRIYLDNNYRGMGIAKELLRRLEADARIAGFSYAILETGKLLTEAYGLYKKMGYKVIPNYGQYVDMPESICMMKKL